ncbi:MAG: ribosome maturation factor RimP [Streptosporangiales bacterium]|nr:ribosome maturation factor RimP [Streptosporangiales bacterium]
MELRDRLEQLVRPAVAGTGLDLETLSVQPAGRRRVVRVVVDRDGGVTSDELAQASQQVSRVLDDADAMGSGAYTLEVSSPGVDRPLVEPWHWRRATGRLVRAPLLGEHDDAAAGEVTGRVVVADEHGVLLEHDGEQLRYPYERLGRGRVELEFRRADQGGDAGDREDLR